MINKRRIFLGLVLIVALLLRVFSLDKFPAGFNADEAAIGYNAYSIINTGRDEYGQLLPLSFKSFGDYKPGLYFYIVLPFVASLGLNEWAVRLPSALLGTGLVLLSYLLAKEFFKDRRVSFFAAFFMAVNPWAIHFSRGGWETNAATFFIALGVFFFLKGTTYYKFLFPSFLSFLVSMYLYQSPRLIVPAFLLCAIVLYRKELVKLFQQNKRQSLTGIILLLILSLPLGLQFISGEGSARFSGLSSFADPGPGNRANQLRGEHQNPGGFAAKIFHNKLTSYAPNFLGHYLDHFSPDFLFIKGDPLIRNKVPDVGQFYIIQSLFLISGLIFLFRFDHKSKYLLVLWILTAPLASAMTYQTPHAVRALSMVVPLILIMAFGFVSLLRLIKVRKSKLLAGILLLLILGFEFMKYTESYYIHYPKRYPLSWEYGFSEMVKKLEKYENDNSKIVVTDKYDQPYILLLFYKKYNPLKYQPQATLSERDKFNFGTVRSFDKYEFHKISPEEIKKYPNVLYVAAPEEAGTESNIIDSVDFPNGEKAFVFVKS
jgi:4-amino-4-deoxy-L-arabinose transferase-like glycosyltransferase